MSARKSLASENAILSPVSKLEKARQLAAIEQKRRIDEACERKVQEKKKRATKRKQTASSLSMHVKKKSKQVERINRQVPQQSTSDVLTPEPQRRLRRSIQQRT